MSTLTLLTLNPASRRCRHDMADPHAMHRTLMALYPHTPEAAARHHLGVLWRAEPGDPPTLLLQSHTAPDVGALPDGYATAQIRDLSAHLRALAAGQIVRYRLTANPARTLRAGGTNHQKTVPAAEIGDWWQRRAQSIGLNPVDTPTAIAQPTRPINRGGHLIPIRATRIDGAAEIGDADALRAAIRGGVGRAKAWGCGLLTVVRHPR